MTKTKAPYATEETWLVRFFGCHRLERYILGEITGNCVQLKDPAGVWGYFEVGKDIELVQKIEESAL